MAASCSVDWARWLEPVYSLERLWSCGDGAKRILVQLSLEWINERCCAYVMCEKRQPCT